MSYFLLFSVLNPLLSLFVLLFFWPILKPVKRGRTRPQFGDEWLAKVGEGWNRKIPAGRPGGATSQSTEWGLFFYIVFTRISAAAFISFFASQVRCLFKNWMPHRNISFYFNGSLFYLYGDQQKHLLIGTAALFYPKCGVYSRAALLRVYSICNSWS